ncbi:MAG: electron transport complex subunit RsxC [Clostridia bacterium]|nr:electron transport complex subunit RsxC [Clostridia bacterium]
MRFPKKPFRSHGGANVVHRKNTKDMESVVMPTPEEVVIPMIQHIGAACVPVVKKGDEVKIGQIIGDTDKFMSAPIHSSISGTVTKIDEIRLPNAQSVQAVTIKSDGKSEVYEGIKPPKVENKDDLIKAVRASGLVGLGGAGFPAHVKLNIPDGKKVDTMIVNLAECEPYITTDYREAIENSWEVMSGIYAIKEILGIDRVIIAVEDNKPEAVKILTDIAENESSDADDRVKVLKLKSKYPQGAEKVTIKVCTNRVVPQGKLPLDVGCLVMNVTSVAFLATYLKTGMPLINKRITLDGSAIQYPKNIIVPIGTKIKDIVEFAGGYKEKPKKIIMGGPMMGIALIDDQTPVLKQNNAILAFNEKDAKLMEPTACIRCGKCVSSCPMNLMPTMLEKYSQAEDVEGLKKYDIMACMECGCCAYNCPAKRNLVQSIRMGKALVRKSQ